LRNHGVKDEVLAVLRSNNINPVKLRALSIEDISQFNLPESDVTTLLENIKELRKLGCTDFLQGDIHLPIWGPVTTTETRLVTDADQPIVMYDHTDYEELMFHFNTITRMTYYPHDIPTTAKTGFDPFFDCRSEIWVLEQYLLRCRNISEDRVKEEIVNLKEEIVRESIAISDVLGCDLYSYVHRVFDDDDD